MARRVIDAGGDLSRRALEAFALEELRAGALPSLSWAKCSSWYTLNDFDAERATLKEIGF